MQAWKQSQSRKAENVAVSMGVKKDEKNEEVCYDKSDITGSTQV